MTKATMQDSIAKLRQIQLGLKQNVANLQGQLNVLDSKPELQNNLDCLKKDIETRASDLEAEVKQLREQLKAMKDLLGLNLEKRSLVDS